MKEVDNGGYNVHPVPLPNSEIKERIRKRYEDCWLFNHKEMLLMNDRIWALRMKMWMLLECYRNSMLEPTAGPQMTHRWLLPSHDCVNIQEPGLETDRSLVSSPVLWLSDKELVNQQMNGHNFLNCKWVWRRYRERIIMKA